MTTTTTTTEGTRLETLFLRFREEGDPAALGALFDATAPGLFRLAVALAPDAATAEDAVQETFLAAMRHARSFDPGRPLLPWLCTILRRKVEDARRRAGRIPDPLRLVPPLLPEDPSSAAARREEIERIRRALDALPEPYRTVGLLRWRYGLEPAEIAEVRREPPGTVRSLLSRALARLRRDLGGRPALLRRRGGRPTRGLSVLREEVLRRAVRRGGVAGGALAAALWTGGALVGKKVVAAGLAAGMLAVVGFLVLRSGGGEHQGGGANAAAGTRETAAAPTGTAPTVLSPGSAVDVIRDPEAAPPIRGRVVDRDGKGIPGARLFTVPDDAGESLVDLAAAGTEGSRTRTVGGDADGKFEVEVDGRAPFYALVAEAPGFARAEKGSVRPGAEGIEIVLDRPAVLVGTVRSMDGAPIAGARIRVNGYTAAGIPFDLSTSSGADGGYRLEGVPPHRFNYFSLWRQRLWLEARAEGFALLVRSGRMALADGELPDLVPGREARQDLWLSRGATLRGRVLDARTREPVADAVVHGLSIEGWGPRSLTLPSGGQQFGGGQWFRPLGETRSGEDGSFTLIHLPCDGFHRSDDDDMTTAVGYVAAWKKGWSFAFAGIPRARDGEEVEAVILLSPAGTVEGRVVDGKGTPVPGALVQAYAEESRWPGSNTLKMFFPDVRGFPANWATSDHEGRYRMEGILLRDGSPAEVTVQAQGPRPTAGFGNAFDGKVTVTATPGERVTAPDLVLEEPSWPAVRFLVVDESGIPVRGARFRAGRRYELPQFMYAQGASLQTGSDGRGTFLFDFGEETPFEIAVDVFAPGHASAREFVVPDLLAPPEVRVVLERGRRLVGRILTADGEPAPGAWVSVGSSGVSVADALPEDQFVGARSSDSGRFLLGFAPAEEDGSFAVEDLPAGPWHVAATAYREHRGAGESKILRTVRPLVEEGVEDLVLVLPEDRAPVGSRLTCTVTDAATGAPIPRCNAALYGTGGRRIDGRPTAPGSFLFEGVPAGTWDLSAAARDYSPGFVRGVEIREEGAVPPLAVALSSGAFVSGRLTDTAGQPAWFADLVFTPVPGGGSSARGLTVLLDGYDGKFRIGGFLPGRYTLEVRPKVAGRPVLHPVNGETLEVGEGDREVRFDVVVSPRATLEVLVTDPRLPSARGTGAPPPPEKAAFGAAGRLAVLDEGGTMVAEVTGLEDGPWKPALTRSLPAGMYTVLLELPGDPPRRESVVLEAEESRRVEFRPR